MYLLFFDINGPFRSCSISKENIKKIISERNKILLFMLPSNLLMMHLYM